MNNHKLPFKTFVTRGFRKYLVLFFIVFALLFIILGNIFTTLIEDYYYEVDELNLSEYQNLSNEFLLKENMTLEVLDSNLNIIESRGIPESTYTKYTPNEFFKLLSSDAYKMDVLHTTINDEKGNEYIVVLKQYLTRNDINSVRNLTLIQSTLLVVGILISAFILFKLFVDGISKNLKKDFDIFKKNLSDPALEVDTSSMKIEELTHLAQHYNNIVQEKNRLISEKEKLDTLSHQLISSLSHDLKSPITTIMGYSNLLSSECTPEEMSKAASYINNAAQELNIMSNMLFDQVKYNSHSFKLNLSKLNVGELLESICAEKYPQFEEKNFQVDFFIDTSIEIPIDEIHFRRACSNIINNCIHHNPIGTQAVISSYLKNNNYIIEIKDNGTGIDDEIKDYIFSPFFSSDTSRSNHSGLGLFISNQIICKHGGTLTLDTDHKFKTIFRISLPYKTNALN